MTMYQAYVQENGALVAGPLETEDLSLAVGQAALWLCERAQAPWIQPREREGLLALSRTAVSIPAAGDVLTFERWALVVARVEQRPSPSPAFDPDDVPLPDEDPRWHAGAAWATEYLLASLRGVDGIDVALSSVDEVALEVVSEVTREIDRARAEGRAEVREAFRRALGSDGALGAEVSS